MRTFTLLVLFLLSFSTFAQQPPPRDTSSVRARYVDDLAELERMKEKFRQQQERRARERDRGGELPAAWSSPVREEAATAPRPGVDPRDTTRLRSSVRSGLYPPPPTDLEARSSWERQVQHDLPERVSEEEAARLDAEYAQQLEEVEALRAKLRQARGEEPAQVTTETTLTAKSPAAPPAAPPATPKVTAITFIPNTAYPNGGGYDGLEALAETIRTAATVVEVRVHTSRNLDGRAAQLLSEERATTIRNYLREAGIAKENYRVIGYGNHESAAGERVEVIVR